MVDVAVQIVNYRTKRYLGECLESLLHDLERSRLSYRVAVLENGSGDDLGDFEARYRGYPIAFYTSPENVGFGKGHNFLADKQEARYLLILNPDVKFMEPRSVERLYERVISEDSVKVVGPKLLTGDPPAPQWWDHGELSSWRAKLESLVGWSTFLWKERHKVMDVAWVSGAAFLIEKATFDKVGGFDPRFFLYYEEVDLCKRVLDEEGRVIYDPTVKVFHHAGVVAGKKKFIRDSATYFIEKHYRGRWNYPLVRFLGGWLA
jgi:N-acetylglucosaminyl-diphospho-decaprenol L-rhamnosyltransferase